MDPDSSVPCRVEALASEELEPSEARVSWVAQAVPSEEVDSMPS